MQKPDNVNIPQELYDKIQNYKSLGILLITLLAPFIIVGLVYIEYGGTTASWITALILVFAAGYISGSSKS